MKHLIDFRVVRNDRIHDNYALLSLTPVNDEKLPDAVPGQFVQIKIDGSQSTFLRRPISINNIDTDRNELSILVRLAGDGTEKLVNAKEGQIFNLMLPLGNGFTVTGENISGRLLLVGGGVGIAPLYYLGRRLKQLGKNITFLVGARSNADLLMVETLKKIAPVHISTDDGSAGEKGVVTTNSIWNENWNRVYCCGPAPMMKAVASIARKNGTKCEVSLENMMACGLGACLCCVEKTVKGNVCVCTEGPVFNIKQLTWHD